MAIFQCLQSGNTVEFTQQHDIDSMKGHSGYILVDEHGSPVQVEEASKELPLAPAKRVGRPRKSAEAAI
jgi:hypothetical protein